MILKILVSACLLGVACRYAGDGKLCPAVAALSREHQLVPVCPEQLGGLPTPRPPVELHGGEAVDKTGVNRTAEFTKGARETLRIAQTLGCKTAVLKSRSPSCGCGEIYDGSFSGRLIQGNGISAQLLIDHGIRVLTEEQIKELGCIQ